MLDPDLWNDDGTAKKPSEEYIDSLEAAAQADDGTFLNFARIKRAARAQRSPEIGDIVHFWDDELARCRAAMVLETEPYSDGACLRVHIPEKSFQDWQADHDEDKAADTWHWPCGEGQ